MRLAHGSAFGLVELTIDPAPWSSWSVAVKTPFQVEKVRGHKNTHGVCCRRWQWLQDNGKSVGTSFFENVVRHI